MKNALALSAVTSVVLSGCTNFLDAELSATRAQIAACTQTFGIAGGFEFVENPDGSGLKAQAVDGLSIRDRTIVNGCLEDVARGEQRSIANARNVAISPCPRGSSVMRGGAQYCVGLK